MIVPIAVMKYQVCLKLRIRSKSAYVLEVSSPGLDRVLFTTDQFNQYLGEPVQVKLAQPVDGARNIKGTIKTVNGDEIVVANEVTEYGFEITNVMKSSVETNDSWSEKNE